MGSSFRFVIHFYYFVLRGLLRKQNLRLPTQPVHFNYNFLLTESLCQKWKQLFGADALDDKIPFTYYWPHYTKSFLKGMDELRFNYRNILHLSHHATFNRDPHGIRAGEEVKIRIDFQDIVYLDRNRAVILSDAYIESTSGELISKSTDAIFLKNLSEQDIALLQNACAFNRTDLSHFRGLSKREPILSGSEIQTNELSIPKNFANYFGKISGDRNPLHTQDWLAKILGYPRAFIQGSATINFIFKFFIGEKQEKLNQLSIIFCQPIFHGQKIQIRYNLGEFELIDNGGKLLAFGTRI